MTMKITIIPKYKDEKDTFTQTGYFTFRLNNIYTFTYTCSHSKNSNFTQDLKCNTSTCYERGW